MYLNGNKSPVTTEVLHSTSSVNSKSRQRDYKAEIREQIDGKCNPAIFFPVKKNKREIKHYSYRQSEVRYF